jgi:hypothetical protein
LWVISRLRLRSGNVRGSQEFASRRSLEARKKVRATRCKAARTVAFAVDQQPVPFPPAALDDAPLPTVPELPLVPLLVPLRPEFIAVLPEPPLAVPARPVVPAPELPLSPPEFIAVLPVPAEPLVPAAPVEPPVPDVPAIWFAAAPLLPFGI